jgi:nickel-dependent lactate racemase
LSRATAPADRVTIAVGEAVPQSDKLAAAAIRSLAEAGVAADGIGLLRTPRDAAEGVGDPAVWLPEALYRDISLLTHDPTRSRDLAYLAALDNGERVVLNRAIVDADIVVPIGCVRSPGTPGDHGVHGAVYPTFADQRTIERFRSPRALNDRGRTKRRVVETVDQVGWMLGIMLTIQVVPGEANRVLGVLAGHAAAVAEQGRALYDAAWRNQAPRRADLVIAAIPGPPAEQTWENFGRALASADALVEDEGLIAICCDLEGELGPALRQLAGAASRHEALHDLRRQHSPDAQAAAQLAHTQDRAAVYLLSRLEPSLVEDLEMIPITSSDDLAHLALRHHRAAVLANAPRAIVTVEE